MPETPGVPGQGAGPRDGARTEKDGVPRSLSAVLDGRTLPGVLSWPAGRPVQEALDAALAAGWQGTVLDLEGVTDKAEFMTRAATALRLPSWFGANWDALADCLGDLSWWPAEHGGRLLAVRAWQGYAAAEPEEWRVAESVLADAVARWRDTDTGLAVLLTRDAGGPAAARR